MAGWRREGGGERDYSPDCGKLQLIEFIDVYNHEPMSRDQPPRMTAGKGHFLLETDQKRHELTSSIISAGHSEILGIEITRILECSEKYRQDEHM